MKFIKYWSVSIKPLCWLMAALLVAGCSSSGPKKSKTEDADSVAVAPAGASILPAGPATPNPYLQNKPSVSGAVAQQFASATKAMRNKQWAQAETLLQQIVTQNSKLSGAWLNLGLVYRAQKEDKRAEQAFTDAINANHSNLDAYNQLAILQREQGRFTDAEANYKKALSIWPWHAESHKNIGILYDLYLGKNAEALAHFEAYQQLRGDGDKQVIGWIADLQRRLGIAPKPKAAPAEAAPEEPAVETNGEEETSNE
ncbi:MAG TPA: tetratricopeptide repeat protein [Cellvibrio sp.]|nr:tetratricopeptide repeat protein [Cellvibrio sp.]